MSRQSKAERQIFVPCLSRGVSRPAAGRTRRAHRTKTLRGRVDVPQTYDRRRHVGSFVEIPVARRRRSTVDYTTTARSCWPAAAAAAAASNESTTTAPVCAVLVIFLL